MMDNIDELLTLADKTTERITGCTFEEKWSGVVFFVTKTKDTLTAELAATIRAQQAEIERLNGAYAPIAAGTHVIAPTEPTLRMLMEGISERQNGQVKDAWKLATENIYRVMIAASQECE